MDWILPLLIFVGLSSLLAWYVRSQLADKDNNKGQSRNIIYPGSVQTSYPSRKLKPFIPISELVETAQKKEEPTQAAPEKKKKKKSGRIPLTREDIIRSYLIDELLDKKVK